MKLNKSLLSLLCLSTLFVVSCKRTPTDEEANSGACTPCQEPTTITLYPHYIFSSTTGTGETFYTYSDDYKSFTGTIYEGINTPITLTYNFDDNYVLKEFIYADSEGINDHLYYEYDENNNRLREYGLYNGNYEETSYTYDEFNRITSETFKLGEKENELKSKNSDLSYSSRIKS